MSGLKSARTAVSFKVFGEETFKWADVFLIVIYTSLSSLKRQTGISEDTTVCPPPPSFLILNSLSDCMETGTNLSGPQQRIYIIFKSEEKARISQIVSYCCFLSIFVFGIRLSFVKKILSCILTGNWYKFRCRCLKLF